MPSSFWVAPTQNFVQTTLSGAITNAATTITLASTTNFQTPGYAIIDRTDSNGTSTPNSREVITYTGISGNQLTGVTRAADGSTARSHADGAVVETILTVGMWNSLITIAQAAFDTNGYLLAINSPVSIAALQIGTRLDISAASLTGLGFSPVFIGPGAYSGPTIGVGGLLIAPRPATLRWVSVITKYVASGGSVGFDFKLRGASVFANATTQPAIAAGGTFVSTASIATTNINAGDIMQGDVSTVATTTLIQEISIQAGTQ